jgi:hypothetical protein
MPDQAVSAFSGIVQGALLPWFKLPAQNMGNSNLSHLLQPPQLAQLLLLCCQQQVLQIPVSSSRSTGHKY